jgi:enoyl-CoA hydratase
VRQAKELLFTGQPLAAQRAYELGMVNRVVPRDELRESTAELAAKIAKMPRLALALAKKAVHAAEDAMGQREAMDSAFALHQLAHLQNELTTGSRTASQGVEAVRQTLGQE